MKKCNKCNEEKSLENFYKHKGYKDGHQTTCRNCIIKTSKKYHKENKYKIKEYYKEYFQVNKEKYNEYQKEYYQENKEKINEYQKKYLKNRKHKDPIFKFSFNVRCLVSNSFKRGKNKFRKNTKTENILGCTIEEFRIYIEKQFKDGMTFENYGEWHLDHIYPISLATTEEEIIKLNHYTNFQPLWAEDNFRKGNRIC
jgi:hypothetical protein